NNVEVDRHAKPLLFFFCSVFEVSKPCANLWLFQKKAPASKKPSFPPLRRVVAASPVGAMAANLTLSAPGRGLLIVDGHGLIAALDLARRVAPAPCQPDFRLI